MFSDRLTIPFTTERLEKIVGTNKTAQQAYLTGGFCMIQPLSEEQFLGSGNLVQMYKAFTERFDIITGDNFLIGTEKFDVKSVSDFTYGSFPHLEILLVKKI